MKTLFVWLLAAGVLCTVNCVCDSTAAGTCATDQTNAISSAGINIAALCTAYQTYITCITTAGCVADPSYSSLVTTAQTYINTLCAGHVVTASMATMLLAVIAMLVK